MKRLVLAFDCDDVLVQTSGVIVEKYNELYGTSVALDAYYRKGDTWQSNSHDEALLRLDGILRDGVIDEIAPDIEVVRAIEQLATIHELHLVTGRQEYMEPATIRLLDAYFPGCFTSVEHTNYVVVANSTYRRRSKGEVCKQIGANVLIDDHIVHCDSVLAAGVSEVIVFGDYPWNNSFELPTGMRRCLRWFGDGGVVKEIERIASR